MTKHSVVDHKTWLQKRIELLAREKEFTQLRDELSAARRELPWEEVSKHYKFATVDGQKSLAELFAGHSQLLIYHFMFGPDWEAGCPSCSFWADNFERNVIHLAHRDIRLLAVARAPLPKLQAYSERLGWSFDWASSQDNDFNADFDVSFSPEELENGTANYNYKAGGFGGTEAPGISVFFRDDDGRVYHTYSTYARGLDMLNAGYHLMDLTPRGRDEAELDFSMAWVRRRDEY
jgi:predicted dithiol-disulfide oxidoreductase (DUF899 family)